ncbi:hypothetical protein HHL16_19205 [Pseudoflavitalea sp. G-6-1-2]|uniref:hypothetical protein n=1 Tax=Pseudoflavitalea sp. G-6-1-2 TaxID=2728841 RepID=UPI00146D8D52|nr:hypothetical protein [Pseudoflavitalea sp. G-6-1-2]NML23014.1 hypothetical protein [Pseudoflavitalea sp. G-6-1-2]
MEKDLLLHQTDLFLRDFNPMVPIRKHATLSAGLRNLVDDWEYNLTVKPQAFFNLVSGGNYYINIVFFSFITFWGHFWFFSLLVKLFPDQRKKWFLLVFFFPPVLFWLSGFRGDGLLFFFLSLCLLQGYRWLKTRSGWALAWAVLGFIGTFIMRDPVAMLLVPALLSVFITVRYNVKPWKSVIIVYGISAILFFVSVGLSPSFNPVKMIADRQAAFFALHGNTRYQLGELQPTVGSFLKVLPEAALNVFFRPAPWEAKGMLQLVSAADICFFWLLVLLALFRNRAAWKQRFNHPFLLFLLVTAVTLFIFTGFTVPFPGAIVRYKVIPELFLLCWIAYTYNKKLHI